MEQVRQTLERVLADTGLRITATFPNFPIPPSAPPSPLSAEIIDPITEITHAMFGANVAVIPVMSTWATDGFSLRAAGIPTYGVSGIFGDPNDVRAHGRDERLLVKSFYDGQEFLHRLVRRLAGGSLTP
jgi:acetylornithine deacetylase/succinyl-diaminopimelate desuccinylase-like protein